MTTIHSITQLLFIDDVLLFGCGTTAEWIKFYDIFNLFMEAYGMDLIPQKSRFYHFFTNPSVLSQVKLLFPFNWCPLEEGNHTITGSLGKWRGGWSTGHFGGSLWVRDLSL